MGEDGRGRGNPARHGGFAAGKQKAWSTDRYKIYRGGKDGPFQLYDLRPSGGPDGETGNPHYDDLEMEIVAEDAEEEKRMPPELCCCSEDMAWEVMGVQ